HHARDPQVRAEERVHALEALGRYADDGIDDPVDAHVSANQHGIAAEPPLPESVTENHDRPRTWCHVFVETKEPAGGRAYAEYIEVVARHHFGERLLRLPLRSEANRPGEWVRGQTSEHLVLVAQIAVVGVGDTEQTAETARRVLVNGVDGRELRG